MVTPDLVRAAMLTVLLAGAGTEVVKRALVLKVTNPNLQNVLTQLASIVLGIAFMFLIQSTTIHRAYSDWVWAGILGYVSGLSSSGHYDLLANALSLFGYEIPIKKG